MATLRFTGIMMKRDIWKILNQIPEPLIEVTLTGRLVEGTEHRS